MLILIFLGNLSKIDHLDTILAYTKYEYGKNSLNTPFKERGVYKWYSDISRYSIGKYARGNGASACNTTKSITPPWVFFKVMFHH